MPEKILTFADFISDVNKRIEKRNNLGIKRDFFIVATFPDGSEIQIKYKFNPKIRLPETHVMYLNHIIDTISSIYDDGGFGTWINVTDERIETE